jgi:hypothetical protein
MIKYMEQMKTNRLKRERNALIVTRKFPAIDILCAYKKSFLPWTELMPEPVDFCNFAPVRAVLELPNEVDVDESSFAEVVPLLPSLFAEWRVDVDDRMLQGFRRMLNKARKPNRRVSESSFVMYDDEFSGGSSGESSGEGTESEEEEIPDTDEQLKEQIVLATTVFKCQSCLSPNWAMGRWNSDDSEDDDDFDEFDPLWGLFPQRPNLIQPLFYPNVLDHQCLTRRARMSYNNSDPSISLDQLHRARTGWSCKILKVNKEAKTMMEVIVEHCGLNPAFATPKDMDERGVLLGCALCAQWSDRTSDDATVHVFGWRTAVGIQSRTRPS